MTPSNRSVFMKNSAFTYFAFYMYKGNFLLGARYNKLLEYPISQHAYVYTINDNPVFNYKFMWIDYIKKINFLKKLYASNSDLWFITNRYEYLGLLDSFALESRAKLFHYNARRLFQEGYVGVPETLNFRMKLMGIENTAGFKDFHNSKDKYYFLINNSKQDKLFLDEMIEPGYNDEPRLCISTANTNSLHINSSMYGLFGNNIPMGSKYFYFSILKRCSGAVGANDFFIRQKTKFLEYGNHSLYRKVHYTGYNLSTGHRCMFFDAGQAAARAVSPGSFHFTMRFNHIHNVFVVKKLKKYFRRTGPASKEVNALWKRGVYRYF